MIEQKIVDLFAQIGLGNVELPIVSVPGGYLHRMYKVHAGGKPYAVKHLNPLIMKRPDAETNFKETEKLESVIEEAGIKIVPALRFAGRKMQLVVGDYFYVFNWVNGHSTDCHHITEIQCTLAGSILGRIHALDPKKGVKAKTEKSCIDFERYIRQSEETDHALFLLFSENEELLRCAGEKLNIARKRLPDIVCISDEDMDPKNVLWDNGQPSVIDLECLAYGNPVSHALQLSLQWSGATIFDIKFSHIEAFFDGYLKVFDNGFREYDKVFGLAYTWLEWLEYNLKRALGDCIDENERELGAIEAKNTIKRIRYLYENEAEIKNVLARL